MTDPTQPPPREDETPYDDAPPEPTPYDAPAGEPTPYESAPEPVEPEPVEPEPVVVDSFAGEPPASAEADPVPEVPQTLADEPPAAPAPADDPPPLPSATPEPVQTYDLPGDVADRAEPEPEPAAAAPADDLRPLASGTPEPAPAYDRPGEVAGSTEPDAADSEPAEAEAEAEPEAEPEPAPAPARVRRARTWLPVAVVGLAVALLAGATGYLADQLRRQSVAEEGRPDAVAAARDAARLLFSYDHQSLAEDFAKGLAVTTGEFRDEYSRTTKEVVTPVAERYDAVVVAEVVEAGIISADAGEVTALVFLNQATTSTRVEGQQVDQSRVRMHLVERDGAWLVDRVEAL